MAETRLSDKPYSFVPLQEVERKNTVNRNAVLKGGYISGVLSFECIAVTPVHISEGTLRVSSDEDSGDKSIAIVRPFMRRSGKPVIPGSSFKGMLRCLFEAFTRSCVLFFPNDSEGYFKGGVPPGAQESCRGKAKVCAACSVFGLPGMRGKIRIPDMEISGEGTMAEIAIPPLKKPFEDYPDNLQNKGYGNARLYYAYEEQGEKAVGKHLRQPQPHFGDMPKGDFYHKFKFTRFPEPICFYGRKFYKLSASRTQAAGPTERSRVEAAGRGSVFSGKIIVEGLTGEEWNALLVALGLARDNWHHSLGQAKPAYYGTVKLQNFSFRPAARFGEKKKQEVGDEALREEARRAFEVFSSGQPEVMHKLEEIFCDLNGGPDWKKVNGIKTY